VPDENTEWNSAAKSYIEAPEKESNLRLSFKPFLELGADEQLKPEDTPKTVYGS
jgi:hypothetical protein